MKFRYLVLFFLFFINSVVFAETFAETFIVKDIKVFGLQKTDEGILLSALPFELNGVFDTTKTSDYIKAIYRTGYFKSISLNRDKNTVYIYVKEKPTIAKIEIVGNESFEEEKLDKALEDIGIRDGGTYDEFTLEKLTKELEQQYLSQGKYSVKINTDVKALERNRVEITINISEGKAAKIKEIRIIGNKSFATNELTEDFTLTEGTLLSWVTFSDRYSKQKLAGDLETLKSFYLNKGYLNFKIQDARISISPDKKDVYIVIQINEGKVYTVNKVAIGGRSREHNETLKKYINIQQGDTYSERNVSAIESNLLAELGRKGYMYARVDINKDIKPNSNTVDLTFFINPGKRVYVRRIMFEGNIRTHDEVLRREMLQMEGGYISKEKIELSKLRLAQLGYIKDINVETVPVSGSSDQVDLLYTLSEANTGHFNGGVGYMEKVGVMLNLGLSQDNFMGTGKSVASNINYSKSVQSANLAYFDPYFTIDGIGLGYNVYYNKTETQDQDISAYKIDQFGADASLRIPLSLFDLLSFSVGANRKDVSLSESADLHFQSFLATHGSQYDQFPFNIAWTHNGLDRALFPTSGWKNSFGASVTIPGSTLNYYQLHNSLKVYTPLYDEFILYLKGDIGYGAGLNSDSSLPFFERYFAGGVGTVRGFEQNSLGMVDGSGRALGGNAKLVGTAELYFPRLFLTNIGWRPSIFVDAGNVYNGSIRLNKINSAVGVGVQWLSPMGPLSLSYAQRIKKYDGAMEKGFNINMGSIF